jgi:uncharacterized membrane protein YkvA (DUF1232 family)
MLSWPATALIACMIMLTRDYFELVSCTGQFCQNICIRDPLALCKEFSMKRLFFVMWRMSKADLRLLWFALKHHDRPGWLLPASVVLALYAIAPFNLALPVLGVVDDMVLVPLALHFLLKLLPPHVLQSFTQNGTTHSR